MGVCALLFDENEGEWVQCSCAPPPLLAGAPRPPLPHAPLAPGLLIRPLDSGRPSSVTPHWAQSPRFRHLEQEEVGFLLPPPSSWED